MTLSPGAKVQPNRSTLRSPAGLSAASNSMLSERAPTPPQFIGQRTWTSRIGSRPKRRGLRVLTDDARNRGLGIVSLDEIEVTVGFRFAKIRYDTLIDAMCVHDDLTLVPPAGILRVVVRAAVRDQFVRVARPTVALKVVRRRNEQPPQRHNLLAHDPFAADIGRCWKRQTSRAS